MQSCSCCVEAVLTCSGVIESTAGRDDFRWAGSLMSELSSYDFHWVLQRVVDAQHHHQHDGSPGERSDCSSLTPCPGHVRGRHACATYPHSWVRLWSKEFWSLLTLFCSIPVVDTSLQLQFRSRGCPRNTALTSSAPVKAAGLRPQSARDAQSARSRIRLLENYKLCGRLVMGHLFAVIPRRQCARTTNRRILLWRLVISCHLLARN